MPTATLDQTELYYEIHGSGMPLVMIAGFCSHHMLWTSILEALSARFQVILIDNRGVGQSAVPEGPYSIEQMADDVADLCRYLKIDHAFFCGSSMGGCIVQALAFRHPKLVAKAVIVNSALAMSTTFRYFIEAQYTLRKMGADDLSVTQMSCSFCYSYQFLSRPGMLEDLIDLKMQDPHPVSLEGYKAQMQALLDFDASEFAQYIVAPTLVLGSDEDLIFNQKVTSAVAEAIPGAAYFCFEGCGHLPYLEYPELFLKKTMTFLLGDS